MFMSAPLASKRETIAIFLVWQARCRAVYPVCQDPVSGEEKREEKEDRVFDIQSRIFLQQYEDNVRLLVDTSDDQRRVSILRIHQERLRQQRCLLLLYRPDLVDVAIAVKQVSHSLSIASLSRLVKGHRFLSLGPRATQHEGTSREISENEKKSSKARMRRSGGRREEKLLSEEERTSSSACRASTRLFHSAV
jgi:hypothetical protein